tara:strand:- start:135 stop:827 length:693 start_codon:yes stop_codon:yes gene_type:complete
VRTQGSTGLIIKGCLFENCTSEAVGVGFGGAIYASSYMSMSDTTVRECHGWIVLAVASSMVVTRTTFERCYSENGILIHVLAEANLELTDSTVVGCNAGSAGIKVDGQATFSGVSIVDSTSHTRFNRVTGYAYVSADDDYMRASFIYAAADSNVSFHGMYMTNVTCEYDTICVADMITAEESATVSLTRHILRQRHVTPILHPRHMAPTPPAHATRLPPCTTRHTRHDLF